ncbi:MAG: DUF368 domain-containing protein [Bacteroidales bacterium]|nr:DUF368 domain-containing protein [Bacteroidales bacterium]
MTVKECIFTVLKGMGMGAANSVPGVSGGTIAFITGIYGRLVNSLNNIDSKAVKLLLSGNFKELWQHVDGGFLCALMGGVLVAMFSFAKLMVYLLGAFPIQTWAFFLGLIIASSIVLLAGIKGWKASDAIWIVLGILLGLAVVWANMWINAGSQSVQTPDTLWFIMLCGMLSITAMILPGISGSFILVLLGKYEYIMIVISDVLKFDTDAIIKLCAFGLGCVIGLLAFARFLHWLMAKYANQTLITLIGFILGSLPVLWPWASWNGYGAIDPLTGAPADLHVMAGVIWILLGIALVLGLEYLGRKSKN